MPHISGLSTCAPGLQPPGTRVHLVAGDIPDHPVGSQGEVLALGVNGLLYGLPGPWVSEAGVHAQLVRPPQQLHASTADAVTCVCTMTNATIFARRHFSTPSPPPLPKKTPPLSPPHPDLNWYRPRLHAYLHTHFLVCCPACGDRAAPTAMAIASTTTTARIAWTTPAHR